MGKSHRRPSALRYTLKVTLRSARPPIWRRLVVPGELTFGDLHFAIQLAMGWTNSHLHQFTIKLVPLLPRLKGAGLARMFSGARGGAIQLSDPQFELEDSEDEDDMLLHELARLPKSRFRYEYDFGDGWEHDVLVEKIEPAGATATLAPRRGKAPPPDQLVYCAAGKGACPPEDCGGLWGYSDLLAALADPAHERHEEAKELLGQDFDPAAFDIEEVNHRLRCSFSAPGGS